MTKTKRLKIRKAAREHGCILCFHSIPKGTEYIEISELDPYDPRKSFVRTEIIGRRHIDCPMTTMKIRQIIDVINKADHDCNRYQTGRDIACPDKAHWKEHLQEWKDKWPHRTRESFRVDALKELFK